MKNKKIVQKLKYWLKPIDKIFADFSDDVLDCNDKQKHRIFIDHGSSVLFVAHLDAVQKPKFIRCRKSKSGKLKRVYAHGLDDRLGCMLAYELSKELNVDLLLTDHEESGRTTIQYHDCGKYNWVVEFDRAGSDVVTYDLSSDEFDKALREFWPVNFGLYSDICNLETQACCFNLGIGYELAHSKDSYVNVDVLKKQIQLFRRFYDKYKDVEFIREMPEYEFELIRWLERCDICGMIGAELVFDWFICQDCFEQMVYEKVLDKEQDVVSL